MSNREDYPRDPFSCAQPVEPILSFVQRINNPTRHMAKKSKSCVAVGYITCDIIPQLALIARLEAAEEHAAD